MQNKTPSTSHDMLGTQFWRRPTLARPIAVLPSGLQRFTAVFGMGTGGATALLSPEVCSERSEQTSGDVIRDSLNRYIGRLSGSRFSYYDSRFSFQRTAASLISTYRLSDSAVVDRRYSDNFV